MNDFIEDIDYYFDAMGRMVLTAFYLKKRGHCCGNGCKHCPYDYEQVREPGRSKLLQKRQIDANDNQKY